MYKYKLDSEKLIPFMDRYTKNGYFYNPTKALMYGRAWNFISCARSIGKTTGVAALCILDYIVNGWNFCYIRRDKDEVIMSANGFFKKPLFGLNETFGWDLDIKYQNRRFYLSREKDENGERIWEKEPCGTTVPLSLVGKYKSGDDMRIRLAVWDEFIPEDDTLYLGSAKNPYREYHALNSLHWSIDRDWGETHSDRVQFFILGNTLTRYNPIYVKLRIPDYFEENTKFIRPKNALWLVENLDAVGATADIETGNAYRLSDDFYKRYAKNTGRDTAGFIRKRPKQAVPYMAFVLNHRVFKIWQDYDTYYICQGSPKDHIKIVLNIEDYEDSTTELITNWKAFPPLNRISDGFKIGRVFFEDNGIKNEILKYLKFT